MSEDHGPAPLELSRDGVTLSAEAAGRGPAIVLLHGLTATRRYVVMGSRFLERRGYRVIGYDARAHGESGAAPAPGAYEYADLTADLEALLDRAEVDEAVLVGSSMGATTALTFALEQPRRVGALVQSTPAYAGKPHSDPAQLAAREALAEGLERDGVDGYMAAYRPAVDERWREPLLRLTRQRLERHRNPRALADAIRVVTVSKAFDGLEQLERLELPTLVIGSRDEADPEHPLAVAEAYVERLPQGELAVEEPGKSPLAWRGAQLSRAIDDFLSRRAPAFAADRR